jgi:nicotinamidase-related amidase
MDVLIVVDMQWDFVGGALGTKEAVEIVPYVVGRVVDGVNRGETILFTRDTHESCYLDTQEGRNLPVPHCIRGTEGWEIIPQLTEYTEGRTIVDKPTFGSAELGTLLQELNQKEPVEKITLIGLRTDICVISNALLAKAFLPEVPVAVDASCCAGVTPESHANALAAMRMCQIAVEHPKT